MSSSKRRPRCIVIAGPNGAGKATFAKEYLLRVAKVLTVTQKRGSLGLVRGFDA
jgi:ABC-type Mn2+/Zn2+ transport system ATPase subunit